MCTWFLLSFVDDFVCLAHNGVHAYMELLFLLLCNLLKCFRIVPMQGLKLLSVVSCSDPSPTLGWDFPILACSFYTLYNG